jgi:PAS domain S-box-containing protein
MTDSAGVVFVVDDDTSIRESLTNLLRTAIEQAGAERGVLVLSRWTEPRIAAQATTGDGGIVVKLQDEAMTPAVLPESVIQYVVRTNESVILDDAAAQNPFSADPYIRQQHARSILCLPFLNQGQLIGVLYLENNLTPGVFTPARIAVLKLLASYVAISLENARLYRELAEREAKIRRLLEAQTPQAEDELRAIIDNAPVFLWSDLPDGYCDFLNQPWLTYFNLSLQEAQGAGWATLLHPDDAARHLESWQKSVATGIPFETEARFRRPDGEYRWFLNRANPLRDNTGRIVKWYGTNIDMENLKQTERRLRQSEANLAEAQRLSHTGSWVLNPATTKIVYWSEECYRIWGFDPVQGLPNRETVWRRIHPDDRDRMYQETQEALRDKRDYKVDFRIVLPDGAVKYLEAIGHHLFSADGELVEVVGTNVDVTERKRAEQVLREREAKIRRLVDANIIGIFIWDFDGRILEANEAFLRIVGYDHEDLVAGRIRWTDLTPPEWRDRDTRLIQEHKVTGALQPFEKEYFRKDGSRVPVMIGVATFEEGGNQGVAFVLDLTERKRAEEALRDRQEALRRSEAWLAQAQKISQTGSWVMGAKRSFLYWSDESYRIWGFDPLQGLPSRESMWERVHPHDRDRVWGEVQEALREKRDFFTEFRILLPDGTVKSLEANNHHEFSPLGELVEVISTHVDVTERKRAEEALREREAKIRRLVDANIIGIFIWDLDGRIIETNDAFLRMVGYDREDLGSDPLRWMELTPPEWRERDERALAELNSTGTFQPFEKEYFRKDGSRVPVLIGGALFQEGGNEGVAFVLDSSEQKRAEEELRRSEAYLAEAQRLSKTGSWAWSPDTGFRYWSEECYRVLGFVPRDGLPRFEEFIQRIHPDDQPAFRESAKRAPHKKLDEEVDYRIVHPGGAVRDIHSIGHPVFSPCGDLIEYTGTVIDITERKRAEEAFRTAQIELAHVTRVATLGEMTASIAHEINQPLGALVNNAGACLGWLDAENLEEARNSVALVMDDAQRASEIITGIRALVKKAPPQKDWLDINQIIREVIGLGQSEVQRNHVALETQLSDDMPLVFADRIQLQQVMLNLMMNAIEAMTQVTTPRELLISSGADDSKSVLVVVRDSGPGLDSKSLERLFEPFYTTKPQGMGMGLAICRSIIEAHGGRLWAASNRDRGASFHFTLPTGEDVG